LTQGDVPEIFIGEYALLGNQQIQAKLGALIDDYLAQGGVEWLRSRCPIAGQPRLRFKRFCVRPCGIRAGDGRHPGDACRTVSYGIHCPVKWQADQRCDAHVADNCRASAHYSRTIRRGTHAAKAESNSRIFGMQTILGRGGDEFADEFVHVQIAEPHRNADDFALRESC
jgi:hypothetical protein